LSNTADLRQRINSNISAEPGQDSSAPSTAPSETATVAASSLDSTTTAGPGSAPAAPHQDSRNSWGDFITYWSLILIGLSLALLLLRRFAVSYMRSFGDNDEL